MNSVHLVNTFYLNIIARSFIKAQCTFDNFLILCHVHRDNCLFDTLTVLYTNAVFQ